MAGSSSTDILGQLACALVQEAAYRGVTIALAESCTGGLISSILTDVPGSSKVFPGGVVSYSNDVKINVLGVLPQTLALHGAVSAETARQMARGIHRLTGAALNLSVTGVAGPGGGTLVKPVGLVYIGLYGPEGIDEVVRCNFSGDRRHIRYQTAREALVLLYEQLLPLCMRYGGNRY